MLDTLTDLYSLYGPIASIRSLSDLITTVGFGYIIIELTDGRYAEVAVINDRMKKQYRIVPDVPSFRNDSHLASMNFNAFPRFYFQLSPSNPPPPMTYELQNPPESESSFNIINKLGDSQLQEIFSYVSLADLCSVADVCTKFRKNAKNTYEISQLEFGTPEIDDVVHFERLARNFGTMIPSLSFNADAYTEIRKNAMLSILVKYFSGPDSRLQSLHLTKMDIDARWYPLLAPIFSKLEYLQLAQSRISKLLCICNELVMLDLCNDVGAFTANSSQTIRALDNLEQLTLWETSEWRDILFRQLDFGERVIVLKIQDSENDQDFQSICDVLTKFSNLEELHLSPRLRFNCLGTEERNKIGDIFKRLVNLSTLVLYATYPTPAASLQPFSGLSGFLNVLAEANVPLKRLKIGHDVSHSELNCISHFGELQSLAIDGLILSPFPLKTMLMKLHHLKELRLVGQKSPTYWDKEDIKEIVDLGKELCFLYFGSWQEELIIFENDFNEILQLVMRRIPRSKLTIIIRSNANITLGVSAEKIAMCSELLQIQKVPWSE